MVLAGGYTPRMFVTNAGPLINLDKLGLLDVLWEVYGEIVMPEEVRREVVDQGFAGGHPNALSISLAIARRRFKVEPIEAVGGL